MAIMPQRHASLSRAISGSMNASSAVGAELRSHEAMCSRKLSNRSSTTVHPSSPRQDAYCTILAWLLDRGKSSRACGSTPSHVSVPHSDRIVDIKLRTTSPSRSTPSGGTQNSMSMGAFPSSRNSLTSCSCNSRAVSYGLHNTIRRPPPAAGFASASQPIPVDLATSPTNRERLRLSRRQVVRLCVFRFSRGIPVRQSAR